MGTFLSVFRRWITKFLDFVGTSNNR
jgi:hypothetical protein